MATDGTPELAAKRCGEAIARLRTMRRWSRAQLVIRLFDEIAPDDPNYDSISETWLARLENGRMVKVPRQTVEALCRALRCSAHERAWVLLSADRNVLADDISEPCAVAELLTYVMDRLYAETHEALRSQLADLLREAQRGVRLNDGLRVAIVGRPNAGKSSLLNALAGSERAIVTDIAGTTRDVVRENITLDGIALELADTAGLRETHDPVEREGVRRAHHERERADVVLLVTDAHHMDADLAWLHDLPSNVERIIAINKIDLDASKAHDEERDDATWLWLSVKTGEGLESLRQKLTYLAGAGSGEGAFSARRRHVLALEQVTEHLDRTAQVLADTHAGELAAEELRQAQHALGEITGTYTSDDLLGAIFSSFCIGK